LVFTFATETDEFIQREEKKLRHQIENLQDVVIFVGQDQFSLQVRAKKFQPFISEFG
jgi:hypothetical protein